MNLNELNAIANSIRQDIIVMLEIAGSGHSAGSLGMADVFTALYFNVLNHNSKKPNWPKRDRLILSNGHICPVLYATLANAGYFKRDELQTFRQLGSRLQGHPQRESLPGLETTSGPLGSGLSQAVGMALGLKEQWIYCLMSDGEQQCGQIWEAAMMAGKYRLSNLTAIIDRNNIQISGSTEDVMPLEPLREKYESFNWQVLEIDGHNIEAIIEACEHAKAITSQPVLIIANTIPGKGVKFMEYDYHWHGKTPTESQAKIAMHQLRTLNNKLDYD